MAIVIPNKADFRTDKIARYRKKCYIMIKESIYQEGMAVLNGYSSNN